MSDSSGIGVVRVIELVDKEEEMAFDERET
jgi:hypothetical protein